MRTSSRAAAALCFLVTLRAGRAHAEAEKPQHAEAEVEAGSESERARTLFKEGRALAASDKYAEACPKFEASLKLDAGIGTKFNLADCRQHVGRPATARALFLEVAEVAHASGQREREDAARARADALDAEIPLLVIDVKVSAPSLEIRRDGVLLEPRKWGSPQRVDPGRHDIEASAPGRKTWATHVDVALTPSPTPVSVPELEDADEPVAAPAKTKTEEKASSVPHKEEPAPLTEDHTVPLVLYTGVGAGAILTGVSLLLYKLSNDKASGICPTGVGCTSDEVRQHSDLVHDAESMRTLSYAGMGLLGASLITAGVLTFSSTPRKEHASMAHRRSISAGPFVGAHGLGAGMSGRF